jgi:hypothetical protein
MLNTSKIISANLHFSSASTCMFQNKVLSLPPNININHITTYEKIADNGPLSGFWTGNLGTG